MVFNSWYFGVFFVIVYSLYRLPLPWTVKKIILLIASYLFYAAWNPPFVLLLILSAIVDFRLAHVIYRSSNIHKRRLVLVCSLILNLGLLCFFKYGNFMISNGNGILEMMNIDFRIPLLNIVLPLGISFYTFETISYLIDVYRGQLEPSESFLDYALFLTFFPHLVAGPIVRASDFLPQCKEERRPTSAQVGWGMMLLVLGLFEKVFLADYCLARVADAVFGASVKVGFLDAWIGALAFSGQIFFDFAGYTTCAIGIALSMGFVLMDNFRFPYAAVGFSDFWQRWHISLSSWLRDYLYIPLGGNRCGSLRTNFNLMLTMLLGGLWHGAAWQFVVWGGLHGVFLVIERAFRSPARRERPRGISGFLQALLTFICVTYAWVFFRATDFTSAFALTKAMFSPWIASTTHIVENTQRAMTLLILAGLLLVHWKLRGSSLEALAAKSPRWAIVLTLTAMLLILALVQGDNRAFIYFQF